MRQLNIFREGIIFRHWGEVYLGCKAQWITLADVLEFCKNGKIIELNEERCLALYLALDNSLFDFYEQIKLFVYEDKYPLINKTEDSLHDILSEYIPTIYWEIWKVEFLLEIRDLPVSYAEKLDEIASLFDQMNYPEDWKSFIYYQNRPNGAFLNETTLYHNFLNYIDRKILELKNME